MGVLVTVVALADLPAPGLPPSAIDPLSANGFPARMTKRNGYNSVDFGFRSDCSGSGTYALYRYWPTDRDWKPEGPRGTTTTPAAIDMSTVAGRNPVRVSTPAVECDVAVVLCSGGPISGFDFGSAPIAVEETNR